jgi:hypothetical protein
MGHLLKLKSAHSKCEDSRVNVRFLASTSVPFTLTVPVPNLSLINKKRITVCGYPSYISKTPPNLLTVSDFILQNAVEATTKDPEPPVGFP